MQELGKALPKLYLKYRVPLDPKKQNANNYNSPPKRRKKGVV